MKNVDQFQCYNNLNILVYKKDKIGLDKIETILTICLISKNQIKM